MQTDALMSMTKLVDARYTPIMTVDYVKVYNTLDIEVTVKANTVLRG